MDEPRLRWKGVVRKEVESLNEGSDEKARVS